MLFCAVSVKSQDWNPPYPRIVSLHFANPGAMSPYFSARNDWVIFWARESNYVATMKALNPNLIVFQTADWNRGQVFSDIGTIPSKWILKHSNGSYVCGYDCSTNWQLDPTDYCSTYTGTIGGYVITNKRYNDAMIQVLTVMANKFDGINSDGTWFYPWGIDDYGSADVDIDHNGVNDITEHGSTWVKNQFVAGWKRIFDGLKATGKKVTQNYGGGVSGDTTSSRVIHGGMWENGMTENGVWLYSIARPNLETWDTVVSTLPRMNNMSADPRADSIASSPDNTDYKYIRWGLGIALLHGFYFKDGGSVYGTGDGGMGDGHWWSWHYDNYNLNLGQPIGRSKVIAGHAQCYARAFDSGLVIVNTSNINHTITATELANSAITGYDPPYYSFIGAMDTTWDNGELFASREFTARDFSTPAFRHGQYIGDALILVKRPNVYAIEELIIDNTYPATTPFQTKCTFSGSWTQNTTATYSGLTNSGISSTVNDVTFGYATAGSGAMATYAFKVNIAGDYKLYEYHGYQSGVASNNASHVHYIVYHSNGTDTVIVNQSINGGKWNELGTYHFNTTGNNMVVITTVGATVGKSVVADAQMLEFVPPQYVSDATKKALIKKL